MIAQAQQAGSLSASAFVDNAARSDIYEMQAAELAVQRSHPAAIKSLAAKMIAGHAKSTAELKAIDPRYVDQQQASHREAEVLMKGCSLAGGNAALKTFAAKMSPIVAEHTKMAERLDRGDADHDNKPDQGGHAGAAG